MLIIGTVPLHVDRVDVQLPGVGPGDVRLGPWVVAAIVGVPPPVGRAGASLLAAGAMSGQEVSWSFTRAATTRAEAYPSITQAATFDGDLAPLFCRSQSASEHCGRLRRRIVLGTALDGGWHARRRSLARCGEYVLRTYRWPQRTWQISKAQLSAIFDKTGAFDQRSLERLIQELTPPVLRSKP
jgi:hypothetical protein